MSKKELLHRIELLEGHVETLLCVAQVRYEQTQGLLDTVRSINETLADPTTRIDL